VAVITGREELFYSQCDDRVTGILLSLAAGPGLTEQAISQVDGSIAASYYSAYTDTYTIVVQGRETLIAAIKDITAVTIIMALFIWVILVAVIGLLSLRVTAPIGQLIARIEQTNLDNIDHDAAIEYKYTDDELVHLRDSYNQLLKRLNHARRQEEQMSLLHLQAEFDALQAQVNPHFIYNVLNVISHRGVLNKDEVICEICEKLASMLRYAGGTSQRLVSVREELDYLEGYLYLLKTRYRDKLEYTIDVEEAVLGQRIPKIALQQFIENSITHGFNNSARIMALSVRGWAAEGRWYIEVRDNGGGFSETGKAALEKQMEAVKKRVREANLNLDIGGMGLLNLYARFLLLFGDAVIFRLANRGGPSGNGAVVTIGVPMSREQFQAAEPGITKCTG
jgi:two-component system sensor histidine kinase YesM